MIRQSSIIVVFMLLSIGCTPTYRSTVDIGDHLYLEHFNINPAGVDEVFLTDSTNFRISLGTFDIEHERIGCELKGDTITVYKDKAGYGGNRVAMDQIQLSRDSLIKNKVNSTKPLLELR